LKNKVPTLSIFLANAISSLILALAYQLKEPHDESTFLKEIFAFDEQLDTFPITFDVISKAQLTDNKIQQCITNNNSDFITRII
jgi:hypothetical protein